MSNNQEQLQAMWEFTKVLGENMKSMWDVLMEVNSHFLEINTGSVRRDKRAEWQSKGFRREFYKLRKSLQLYLTTQKPTEPLPTVDSPPFKSGLTLLYFSNVRRRPITHLKDLLRSYGINTRHLIFSFVGLDNLEVVLPADLETYVRTKMLWNGHPPNYHFDPSAPTAVSGKYFSFEERSNYAKSACIRRWSSLRDRAVATTVRAFYEDKIENLSFSTPPNSPPLNPTALPFKPRLPVPFPQYPEAPQRPQPLPELDEEAVMDISLLFEEVSGIGTEDQLERQPALKKRSTGLKRGFLLGGFG